MEPGRRERGCGVGLLEALHGQPGMRGRGEKRDLRDDGRRRISVREERAAAVQRVDPDPHAPVQLPLREVDMPDAAAGPADLLAGTNLLSRRHDRRHMPVREMAGVDAAVDAAAALDVRGRRDDARVERVDAVRQPCRRPRLGTRVVDVDVDPEVVAGETVVISPARVDERPPDRMLHHPRRNRPTPRKSVVVVGETRRQRTRHTAVDRSIRRRLRRHPRSDAPTTPAETKNTPPNTTASQHQRGGGQPSQSQRRSCRGAREYPSHAELVGREGFDPHLPRQERGALPLELPAHTDCPSTRPS